MLISILISIWDKHWLYMELFDFLCISQIQIMIMKVLRIITILFISFGIIACKTDTKPNAVDDKGAYFGEKISAESVIDFNELMSRMSTEDEVEAIVSGKVESVCQAKGCWMNIVSPDGSRNEEMFVKFKDYGFFMPLDISGREVIMRGKAYKEETSVDELRHYAEDEGKTAEEIAAITESVVELKFMADGVILKP